MRQWKLANPWGNLRSGDPSDLTAGFIAGRLVDALRLNLPPYNPLLVASDSSGVWLVSESGGPAIPLSWTWTAPQLNCLARGYYEERHVYAGGVGLYETDVTSPAPLYAWRAISLMGMDDHPAPVGTILRMVVVRERGMLVLATSTGVWWVRIAQTPGGPYVAMQAMGPLGQPMPGSAYSCVVEGPNTSVVAACWGTNLVNAFGIFVGDWSGPGGGLQFFTRATIQGTKARQMLKTELAVCVADRNWMYAVCGGALVTPVLDANGNPVPDPATGGVQWTSADDFVLAVLRSTDGGLNWDVTGDHVSGKTEGLFPGGPGAKDLVGHTQGGHNLCVGVSPFHREVVAVGVVQFVLSLDGGKRWDAYAARESAHRHEDTTACYFDPLDPSMLHICSDGGLATTTDLGTTWRSTANRQLPNLLFYRAAISSRDDGLTAGSLQDNGDMYALLYPLAEPWRLLPEHVGGDGILSMFTNTGHLIHHNNTESRPDPQGVTIEFGAKPRACSWDPSQRQFSNVKMFPNFPLSLGVIPVDGTNDGLVSNVNSGVNNVIEVVTSPAWKNTTGEVMVGVAAEGESVYGLFAKSDGTFHWQVLGSVLHRPDIDPTTNLELPYFATASASMDGHDVIVGMSNGRVFRLSEPGWAATDLSDPAISAPVTRIAPLRPGEFVMIAGPGVFRWNGSWTIVPTGPATGLPSGDHFYALAVDRSAGPPRLFVATQYGVWQSENDAATWQVDTIGLPTVPFCWDLRTVIESSGAAFVYLGTYGWSVFRRLTNFDELTQTVAIVGHMDIVDRVAVGKDVWGHPTFTRIATLGPLSPIAEWLVTGDNGDQVRVDLKLRVAWKIDRSMHVDWDAKLFDMGSDNDENEETDHETGKRVVAFKGTETVVIDMDSDEWWPDRAHVEFIIKNF